MRKSIALLLLCVLCRAGEGHAQLPSDSMRIYYRQGHRDVDPSFGDNRAELDRFLHSVRHACESGDVNRLVIRSYASPDGLDRSNERLSRLRADSMESYVLRATAIPASMIEKHAEGIAWEQLRALIAAADRMPYREEVLEILDNTPLWICDGAGRIVDGRKKQLMSLRGGVPYNYMLEHFFPVLRNSAAASLYTKDSGKAVAGSADSAAAEEIDPATAGDSAALASNATTEARTASEAAAKAHLAAVAVSEAAVAESRSDSEIAGDASARVATGLRTDEGESVAEPDPLHRIAVKTNLLYDVVLMPSLEVEYRIDDRWSVAIEGDLAWWRNSPKHKFYQVAAIVPEGRYWFSTRKPWHGHYVGLFAGGTWYDLENGGPGYRGEAFLTGISYGYMWPVSRSLSLEAGIGIGYAYAQYEEYRPKEGHYVYQQTSRTNYFGPLKLKLAFVWRLWDKNKEKGGAR